VDLAGEHRARDVRGPLCPECHTGTFKGWKRIVLHPLPMPTEDIFVARGLPGTKLASRRFLEWYRANDVTGVKFIPASEHWYAASWRDEDRFKPMP